MNKIKLMDEEDNAFRLHAGFEEWIKAAGFDYSATLTYPQEYAPFGLVEAERMAKKFVEIYNKRLGYGCNARRNVKLDKTKGAKIAVINDYLSEGGKQVNFHHHLALAKPTDWNDADFIEVVNTSWKRCFYKRSGITLVEPISGGWQRYLASKLDVGDQLRFDVFNSNIY